MKRITDINTALEEKKTIKPKTKRPTKESRLMEQCKAAIENAGDSARSDKTLVRAK